MTSRMLEETLAAPGAVARQEDAQCAALGAYLREQPPTSVVTVARGSSDHAATYLAYLITTRTGRLVSSLPLSLVTLYNAPLMADRVLALAISQSGASPDVVEPMAKLRQSGAVTAALVNDTASPLAQTAQWLLPLQAGPELSVAATKSFICSLTAGVRLTAHWAGSTDLLKALGTLPASLEKACEVDWSGPVPFLAATERLMVIARGIGLSIAQEAALKFKETCGIQAEAFSAAEVRHGPQAVVDAGYPMLLFALRGPSQAEVIALAQEMRERGAKVILAAPADVPGRDLTLATTDLEELDPIAAIQSFYTMVEGVSRARGWDPDRPPHLHKVTTTR